MPKIKSLLGMGFDEFCKMIEEPLDDEDKAIVAKPSRLIPLGKDDEMAMTSVFLSALKLVKEFRYLFFDQADLTKKGNLYCYTEVEFPFIYKTPEFKNEEKSRFDGLALVVGGGKIKDACIFEMKYGSAKIEKEQIEKYIRLAKNLGIQKIISVSNQFVTKPTDYPVSINTKKWSGQLYHFSWSYIVFLAQILLKKNGTDIEDIDQQNIMDEVVRYLQDCDGIKHFDSMKTTEKWHTLVNDLASIYVKPEYKKDREDIVESWIQEEKDLALKLSYLLSGKKFTPIKIKTKYKTLSERIEKESEQLKEKRALFSVYDIPDAVSPMNIKVDFRARSFFVTMTVDVPNDKTAKGKIGFIKKYVKKAQEVNEEGFKGIQEHIECIITPKSKKDEAWKKTIKELMSESLELPKIDFNNIGFTMHVVLDKEMLSPSKFIEAIEKWVQDYYSILMQYFEKWTPQTPKADTKPALKPIDNTPEANKDME